LITKGVVARVTPGGIADELGIEPGDQLISVNDSPVKDIIDLSFALSDEYVELVIEKPNGEQELLEIDKEYDEELGIEFESAVFDRVRQCANKCVFCFVDQMAPGMRESLYIKDDDYRLSFLYGNFITLTNINPADIKRIINLHLSPLYVSVHVTDGAIRANMLNNERAKDIMKQLRQLTDAGIELHTQVVLCPGINDGSVLGKTISDLFAMHPGILSMAIVPVGLTRYRDNCHPLESFSSEQAQKVIETVAKWQSQCLMKSGTRFVFLADEFYLAARRPIPEYEAYEGFPQLENGVGIVRSFLQEWAEQDLSSADYKNPLNIDVVCGTSAAHILGPLLEGLKIPNLSLRLVPVENKFFGPNVTVTGLLTGQDIADKLRSLDGQRSGIIIPGIALRKGENVFLDGLTPDDIANRVGAPVRVAYFAADLAELLTKWR
jgi:putative radical SAM enzyme (TIGR03279 family)